MGIVLDGVVGDGGGVGRVGSRGGVKEFEGDFGFDEFGDGITFKSGDGASKELAVEAKADGGDVSTLGGAKEVARTADFKVAKGDSVAGAKGAMAFEGLEAFTGVRVKGTIGREEEIGKGFDVGAANASAKLIEVGKAEAVGSVNEDGVDARDVDATFNDGGAKEEVGLATFEGVHGLGEGLGRHLAVGNEDAEVGEEGS